MITRCGLWWCCCWVGVAAIHPDVLKQLAIRPQLLASFARDILGVRTRGSALNRAQANMGARQGQIPRAGGGDSQSMLRTVSRVVGMTAWHRMAKR